MTVGDWQQTATTKLVKADIASARLDSLLLLEHVIGLSRESILAHPEKPLKAKAVADLNKLLSRRLDRVPLVHLTGHRRFFNLELEITPDVLTPRAETERAVELAIEYAPKQGHLLDLGTGSGAIALAIGLARPDLKITASDLSDSALKVAKRNATRYRLSTNFVRSDLFKALPGSFDLVVANLPYLPSQAELMPEVTREPPVALFGGADGLSLYRRFLAEVSSHLEPDGVVIIEADPWQHQPLIELAKAGGLKPIDQGYFILAFRYVKHK